MKTYFKQKAWRSEKYLKYIRKQPCIICGNPETIAHHVQVKGNHGTGIKPGDNWTLSLCKLHHAEIHYGGKEIFYKRHCVDVYHELFKLVSNYLRG